MAASRSFVPSIGLLFRSQGDARRWRRLAQPPDEFC